MKTFFIKTLEKTLDVIFALVPQKGISKNDPKWIAHRGAPSPPLVENTLASFSKCIEAKVWGIEFDVQWTLDNVPVVHHDPHCERLFSRPNIVIANLNFAVLRDQIPEIPTLNEVLSLVQKKTHCMIELKSPLTSEQENLLFNQLSLLTPCLDYHLLSLRPQILKGLKLFPAKCFVLVSELNKKVDREFVLKHNWGGYASHYFLVTSSQIGQFHDNQIKVGTGYMASKNCLNREINRNVDWHFTNDLNIVYQISKKSL